MSLAHVPFKLDEGVAVVLFEHGIVYRWLKKATATSDQLTAFHDVVIALRRGKIVKVTINSADRMGRGFNNHIPADREFCHGTASWSVEEVPPQSAHVKTLLGQIDISCEFSTTRLFLVCMLTAILVGSRLYPANQESAFVQGNRYVLRNKRVPRFGFQGIALKQESTDRHSGYVSRDTVDLVELYLMPQNRVVVKVTSAWEGNRGVFDRRLHVVRDW